MRMIEELIREHDFFKGLGPEYRALLAGCATNVRFNPQEFIFREGDGADTFYVIRHGKVALGVHVPGRGFETIQTVDQGDVLGWSWLFEPYHWHFDARVLVLTRAIAFDGQCLRDKCDTDHEFGYAMMKRFGQIIIQRLQATRLQSLDLYGLQK